MCWPISSQEPWRKCILSESVPVQVHNLCRYDADFSRPSIIVKSVDQTTAHRQELSASSSILVITINHSNAGFFAYVMFVLNQLTYAEEHGMIPVVYFGPQSGDGPNAFHDPKRGHNTWDYYFEPVAEYTYAEIRQWVEDPTHPLGETNLHRLSDVEQSWLHAGRPESIYNYQYGRFTHFRGDIDAWFVDQRSRAHRLVSQYIHIKPAVRLEVETFVEEHFMQRPMLGLHLRGTDKGYASDAHAIMSVVPPQRYFRHIDAFLEQHPQGAVFVATDQQQYVEVLSARYGARIVSRPAIRSRNHLNPFQVEDGQNYRKGLEVLVDCLLLSRCDRLVKCTSAVGEFALYFNPSLPCIDVNQGGETSLWRVRMRRLLRSDAAAFVHEWRQLAARPDTTPMNLLRFALAWNPAMSATYQWMERRRFSPHAWLRWPALIKDFVALKLRGAELPGEQILERAKHASRRVGSGYYTFAEAPRRKYLEIRNDADPSAAFFAQFVMVLQQIRFAELHRLIPVVNLGQRYNFYRDGESPTNVWECFFAPVAGVSASALEARDPCEITFLEAKRQSRLFLGEGDEPPLHYDQNAKLWWKRQRTMGAALTAKYVRVNPDILRTVQAFRETEFGARKVLGVHLRGTDKNTRHDGRSMDAPLAFRRIIGPDEYWPVVDCYLKRHPSALVFVATDQRQFLDAFIERYGDKVRFTDSTRSSTQTAVFRLDSAGVRRGAEVLLDCLLLSRCDYLIKCMSNVGEVALYFNPSMPVVDMMYAEAIEAFVRDSASA